MRRLIAPLLLALALPVMAEKPANLQPLPEPPPPPPGMADQTSEPEVTIRRDGENEVEEFRMRGKLYMVKVTPRHGVPYYLVDKTGDGQLSRQDADPGTSVPMWVIKSW